MNSNGREVEFRKIGVDIAMWVERDCAPFDDYLCGILRRDGEGVLPLPPNPERSDALQIATRSGRRGG